MRYERITFEEREEFFRLRYEERLPLRETGERPGKDKSSVSRELKRGTKNRLYNPVTGEANRRNAGRRQCPKLKMTDELSILIKPNRAGRPDRLRNGWKRNILVIRWARKRYTIIFTST
jgi:IS30 family transposase